MVQGFNHNIKHKGKLYHIQTEDSGRDNPHIITHVFVGGNILASKKTSYADIVKADRLEQIVRELMEEQHKSVLRNLINGVYDNTASAVTTDVVDAASVPVTQPAAKAAPKPAAAPAAAKPPVPVPVRTTPNVPVSAGPKAAGPKSGGGEKSLDEIILSYLADRDE
jgi:hypothetical protein